MVDHSMGADQTAGVIWSLPSQYAATNATIPER